MDESPSHKRHKRQRFQPFVIKKGIVMRTKQRQKMALELSKSKNDSTTYNDPKLTQLKSNNRSLSKALAEQKMDNKCLVDDKIKMQKDLLASHEVILALRSELKTHEDDLLQIHEVFRSSLQLLVTLTGHLNVGLQRCTAGRRRSKSVSMGTAGQPVRASLSLAGHVAQNDGSVGSPRQSGAAGRKLHKVLPTVAGNVISHPSIVLPRLPAGGGWLVAPPAGSHRGADQQESMDDEDPDDEEDEETEDEPEPLTEAGDGGAVSAPLADLSVILEQSVLDADSASSSARRRSSAGRSSGSLPFAQVVVPAEERLFGDEAWMRQRTPGRERVVVAAEERLFGDEAWRRQRRRGPARVLVPADERLSGDEAWRRSDGSSFESPGTASTAAAAAAAARRSESRPSQGRPSAGSAADSDRTGLGAAPPPAASSGQQTPAGDPSHSPARRAGTLCNGDVSAAVVASPTAVASSPAPEMEESLVIQRRTQRPRAAGRSSTVSAAGDTPPSHPPASENTSYMAPADPDESVIISRRQASPEPDESISNSLLADTDADESIIVSRKPVGAHRLATAQRTASPAADESTLASRRATAAVAEVPPAVASPPADQDADQSVVISRKVRRQPRGYTTPTEDADRSVIISRRVRRPGPAAGAVAATTDAEADLEVETTAAPAAASVASPAAAPAPEAAPAAAPTPEAAPAAAPAAKPRNKRKGRFVREKRQRNPKVSAEASDTAAAAAICRDEATPSPELGVKERYRHMLARRSPRAAADSRVAPSSVDDPLEGPSSRVWLAAPSPAGRRPRGRPRSRTAAPAEDDKRRERQQDSKLSSPVVVMVDRAAVSAPADSSESEPPQQPAAAPAKHSRRRRTTDSAARCEDAGASDSGTGDGGDRSHSVSPPAAKRGRGGRSRGQGARGRGGGGRGRGGGKGRRSVSTEPLPPLPVPDWSAAPAAERVSDGKDAERDSELFVYPELVTLSPGPGPELELERVKTRLFPAGPADTEPRQPARAGERPDEGSAADSAAPAEDTRKPANGTESPSSTAPGAAEKETRDSAAPGTEADCVSSEPSVEAPGTSEDSTSGVVSAEPTSTTEPPQAAESSTDGSPESPSSSVPARLVSAGLPDPARLVSVEPSDPVPPAAVEPSGPVPAAAVEPSGPVPPAAAEPSGPVLPAAVEPSGPVPPAAVEPSDWPQPSPAAAAEPSASAASGTGDSSVPAPLAEAAPSGRGSPDALPWSAMEPPAPDSPVRAIRSARTTPQSSPGSEDLAAERGGGRRRRKPVSYAEPHLNKKLRR